MDATASHDADAALDALDGQTVAALGYGNQGRAQALNLCDSGLDVAVGNRADGSRERALADGVDARPRCSGSPGTPRSGRKSGPARSRRPSAVRPRAASRAASRRRRRPTS